MSVSINPQLYEAAMVRLKSDRWYSAEGQRRSKSRVATQAAGSRRLISMCFLLALVVLLMQKAADPQHVRNAFNALGVSLDSGPLDSGPLDSGPLDSGPLDSRPLENEFATSTATGRPAESTPARTAWETTCADLIPRLLDDATNENIDDIALLWFAPEGKTDEPELFSKPAIESSLAAEAEPMFAELAKLTQASDTASDEKRDWLERLEMFRQQWLNLWDVSTQEKVASQRVSSGLASALTSYLDSRLLQSLQDATTWSKSETVVFWRLIQRGQGGAGEPVTLAPILNTLQLESEAGLYRGRMVSFRGSVRRVERVNKSFTPLGIEGGYWLLWLRGDDDALQPVAAYTSDMRAEELAARIDERTIDFPVIEVSAISAKRLAYGSAAGVQVAPTLFVHSLTTLTSPAPPFEATDTVELRRQLWLALLAGGVLAVAVLTPIWFQFRRAAQPARRQSARNVLLMLVVATMGSTVPAANAWSQTPPWATSTTTESVDELVVANIKQAFDERSVRELRQHLSGASPQFPNLILKTIMNVRRIGWQRAFELEPIEAPQGNVTIVSKQVSGWVRLAMPVQLDEAQRGWFLSEGQPQLYRLEVQPTADASAQSLVTVYCERVPALWQSSARLRQPVQLDVLVIEDQRQPAPAICGICDRVKWLLPKSVDAGELEPRLGLEYLRLGAAGWDLANFDVVLQHNQKSISRDESDGFFSLIRIASEQTMLASTSQLDRPLDVLRDTSQSIGKQVHWRVRIVSGTLVQVEDPKQQQLLGSDSYIQYDGFVDIGSDRIRFRTDASGAPAQIVDFQGEFPITIIGSSDAPFTPSASIKHAERSWRVDHFAELQGIFYRMWSYQSELVEAHNSAARQIAPLVIATRIDAIAAPSRADDNTVGWFGWALCVSTVVILAAMLVLVFSKERRLRALRGSRF